MSKGSDQRRLEQHARARVPFRRDKQKDNCERKTKLDQNDAENKAFWWRMRAYKCPVCHSFHLTSKV